MAEQVQAYIALGSNIEPKLDHLQAAINFLDQDEQVHIQSQSSVYDTAPVGYTDQDNFLNMVVEIKTSLAPLDLLDLCQEIEAQLKRVRSIKNGPRTIDLDILLYGKQQIEDDRLLVPHPRMHERAFVLYPLAEIGGEQEITGTGQTVQEWKEKLDPASRQDVKNLGSL